MVLVAIIIAIVYVVTNKRHSTPSTAHAPAHAPANNARSTAPNQSGELRMNPIYEASQHDEDDNGDFDFGNGSQPKTVPGAEAGYIDVEGAAK